MQLGQQFTNGNSRPGSGLAHIQWAIDDHADRFVGGSPVGMTHWNVHVRSESVQRLSIESADSEAICVPIQIKQVHSSASYHQATHPKYDRRGRELLSGYGPLYSLYCLMLLTPPPP